MSPRPDSLDDFGRFTEPAVMILVSLAERPRHGYSMAEDIEHVTGVRPGPGTLYGALGRLEKRGFITPLPAADHRTEYELTPAGRAALNARLNAMAAVARLGRARLAQA